MDKKKAAKYAKQFEGKICQGWRIGDYINCGKSAVVMKAKKGKTFGAIKIFDSELIENHGAEIQIKRIEREKSLMGCRHPNLIRILGGGFWEEESHYFIVMEYLPWKNLADVLQKIPRGTERVIIKQVALAAMYLDSKDICHRDIKPENIAISEDYKSVKLLDLGVMKPHGATSITDGAKGKIFIGTLKYSPPEMLLRKELDTKEAWTAINYYQIGGVLHDLITRRTLFADFENPYAILVNAVQHEKPVIEDGLADADLTELARYCLIKCPQSRLSLVTWESFISPPPERRDTIADLRSRIIREQIAKLADKNETQRNSLHAPSATLLKEYASAIESICRVECVENSTIFPPIEILQTTEDASEAISIKFPPSPSRGIPFFLDIRITLSFDDPYNEIVKINISSVISRVKLLTCDEWHDPSLLFRGHFSIDSIQKDILPALYKSIATATRSVDIDTPTTVNLKNNE